MRLECAPTKRFTATNFCFLFHSLQVHVMDNDGPSQPLSPHAPFAANATSDGWTQRSVLARARSMADAQSVVAAYAASTGGTCIAGCNIMIALPFSPALPSAAAAFVYAAASFIHSIFVTSCTGTKGTACRAVFACLTPPPPSPAPPL